MKVHQTHRKKVILAQNTEKRINLQSFFNQLDKPYNEMTRSRKTEYIINNARLSNQLTIKTANRDNTSNDRSMNLQPNNNTMFNYHMTRNKKDDNILNNTSKTTYKTLEDKQEKLLTQFQNLNTKYMSLQTLFYKHHLNQNYFGIHQQDFIQLALQQYQNLIKSLLLQN
jgi:hypothetical protein